MIANEILQILSTFRLSFIVIKDFILVPHLPEQIQFRFLSLLSRPFPDVPKQIGLQTFGREKLVVTGSKP